MRAALREESMMKEKTLEAMRTFSLAASDLLIAANEEDVDLSPGYPFTESFDEVVAAVANWRHKMTATMRTPLEEQRLGMNALASALARKQVKDVGVELAGGGLYEVTIATVNRLAGTRGFCLVTNWDGPWVLGFYARRGDDDDVVSVRVADEGVSPGIVADIVYAILSRCGVLS